MSETYGMSAAEASGLRRVLGEGSVNVMGKPYAGKDTHGTPLAEIVGAPLIDGKPLGAGMLLRNSRDSLSPEILEILDKGDIVPTEVFSQALIPALDRYPGQPLILSGVARKPGEPEAVIEALEATGHPLRAIVHIDISDEESVWRHGASHRTEGGAIRPDDTPEAHRNRLEVFAGEPTAAIYQYRELGIPYIRLTADALSQRFVFRQMTLSLAALLGAWA